MGWEPFYLSAKLALWTMLILPFFAAPMACALVFGRFPGKSIVDVLVSLSMVLPPTVLGFGLLLAMGPQSFLGMVWEDVTGCRLVFSFPGILLASLVFNLPFAVQPLRTAFEKLDSRLLESAAILGLCPFKVFLRVIMPNSLGGLAASSILVFAHSLGEFGVILMVGGSIPGETKVASVAIYEAVEALRFEDAFLMSALLVPICFVVLLVLNATTRRQA